MILYREDAKVAKSKEERRKNIRIFAFLACLAVKRFYAHPSS